MRYVVALLSIPALCVLQALAAPPAAGGQVTIVFRFDGPSSNQSVQEMKREVDAIMQDSGVRVNWRNRNDLRPTESFPNLVVVTFHGKCVMEPVPFLYDERGPLAFTNTSDGDVLPFSEIACDRVRSSVRSAMWGGDFARSDLLFGRALARVLAHELYHMLAGTDSHADTGIAKRALSGSELISDQLRLNQAELNRIHSGASH